MKYKLNPERAINKKIEDCKRDLNIEIEIKKRNLGHDTYIRSI